MTLDKTHEYDERARIEKWERRGRWIPSIEVQAIEIVGQEWPLVMVERWEQNDVGERRFVDSRIYDPPKTA